jgi:hypothetical protein
MAATGEITNASNPMDPEKAVAISAVCEEYLAALMLSSSNQYCFGELHTDLKNQYGYGKDCYPKITDACLSMLNCWTPSAATNTPRTPRNPPTCPPPSPWKMKPLFLSKMLPNVLLLCPSHLINHLHSQMTTPLMAQNSCQRNLLVFVARAVVS